MGAGCCWDSVVKIAEVGGAVVTVDICVEAVVGEIDDPGLAWFPAVHAVSRVSAPQSTPLRIRMNAMIGLEVPTGLARARSFGPAVNSIGLSAREASLRCPTTFEKAGRDLIGDPTTAAGRNGNFSLGCTRRLSRLSSSRLLDLPISPLLVHAGSHQVVVIDRTHQFAVGEADPISLPVVESIDQLHLASLACDPTGDGVDEHDGFATFERGVECDVLFGMRTPGGIRTHDLWIKSPLPYRLATGAEPMQERWVHNFGSTRQSYRGSAPDAVCIPLNRGSHRSIG